MEQFLEGAQRRCWNGGAKNMKDSFGQLEGLSQFVEK